MDVTTATFWVQTAQLLLQAVGTIPLFKKDRTAEDEQALIALSEAYHATLAYYAASEEARNVSAQMNIADKWCKAGILLRKYDSGLASRLDLKSRYWREGATWDEQAIRDAQIGLNDVWSATNVRLSSKS